jgi:ubiquinone biosynthesis protein COQ9
MTTQTHDFADMTLDELRVALAPDIAASAIFDGWNATALMAAAEMAGCDPDVARLAFPGKGAGGLPMEMIAAWIASVDQAMEAEWPAERLATLKIRERIRTLVAFRLDAVADVDEAVRRALAVFVNDESEGKADTHAFLERRIEGVMRFEKVKAQFLGKDREMPSLSRFLGRLRYPAR